MRKAYFLSELHFRLLFWDGSRIPLTTFGVSRPDQHYWAFLNGKLELDAWRFLGTGVDFLGVLVALDVTHNLFYSGSR